MRKDVPRLQLFLCRENDSFYVCSPVNVLMVKHVPICDRNIQWQKLSSITRCLWSAEDKACNHTGTHVLWLYLYPATRCIACCLICHLVEIHDPDLWCCLLYICSNTMSPAERKQRTARSLCLSTAVFTLNPGLTRLPQQSPLKGKALRVTLLSWE